MKGRLRGWAFCETARETFMHSPLPTCDGTKVVKPPGRPVGRCHLARTGEGEWGAEGYDLSPRPTPEVGGGEAF